MLKAWSDEELECLRDAVHSNIQLKVIAGHLGRTVSAISKVITRQGIRPVAQKRGKPKGSNRDVPLAQKLERDREMMRRLTKLYLGECWGQELPTKCVQKNMSSLKVLGIRDRSLRRRKRRKRGEPTHILASLALAKAWAQEMGIVFCHYPHSVAHPHPVYIVGQKLVSETKLIMTINDARIAKGLTPFAIDELCWD